MKFLQGLIAAVLLVPTLALAQQDEKQPEVARAQFTSDVVNREPADQMVRLEPNTSRVYFFTDLRNLGGQTVTHRWEYRGETMAEVSFNVGGDRWRVWSSKNLVPEWTGDWTVVVTDAGGNVLHQDTLIYGE